MTENIEMTEEEAEQLVRSLGSGENGMSASQVEQQVNVHSFLKDASRNKTLEINKGFSRPAVSLSNVTEEELGHGEITVRGLQKISLFCNAVGNKKGFANYFAQKAEILNATSLGKNAELLKLAVMQKKIISDETRKTPQKKGLFGGGGQQQQGGDNLQYLDGRY
jgi:hypothetical protein|tara:strand:- start:1272 stop:1766 length:495 start_codon:yes stop_codon:yes gene_type:complete